MDPGLPGKPTGEAMYVGKLNEVPTLLLLLGVRRGRDNWRWVLRELRQHGLYLFGHHVDVGHSIHAIEPAERPVMWQYRRSLAVIGLEPGNDGFAVIVGTPHALAAAARIAHAGN